MSMNSQIDITFDFRSDTPPKKDPDSHSPTLCKYHKLLWSKLLPNGANFELEDTRRGAYLFHESDEVGKFFLSSDALIPTFTREPKISHIINQVPLEEQDEFNRIGYTIGGMIVFPGNQINRKMTINGARGCHPRIKDRFDLTVECIRRHYNNESSPLEGVLERYSAFFELFGDFRRYVEFFLLQDIVSDDFSSVNFFTPFEDFYLWPWPKNLNSYLLYRQLAIGFIEARNQRILNYYDL
jgi:hypothetical protein